ncbi:MAG TPA: ribosome maturation factor RimP [Actinomycetota bacterium]|jgi:ribosome maturation factor RimP|nr:ribosome maturation factor RimP [Actinomycetota bacterium]HVM06951.1 ribosome maturation factor RimP [Acidimicrobiales bacterium]
MGPVAERVHELVEPLVTASGLELVDVEHGPGLLKITLDKEGGIDLETITEASEQISDLLDVHDPVPGRYTLEVTSPGLERPLRTPQQFKRFVGTPIVVRTQPGVEGERRVQDILESADDEAIVVGGRRLAYADIERARTVFEWGGAEKKTNAGKPNKGQKRGIGRR